MSNSLPEGWSSVKLSEIADVVSGGTPSRDVAEFWAPADIDWVTPTDITKDSKRALNESSEKISFKGLRNSSAKTLPVGTILMTSRATLGEMKIAEIECCTNQGFKSLIVKHNIDNWFLYYQMKRKKSCYERLGIGSTFLEVNKKDTDNFEVELAPFKQQQKIAKILSTVDNLIEQTQNLIDKYTAVKQGMMADLFSRGIDLSGTPENNKSYGQLRPSYEEAPELYQETELGWVPKGWDVHPLENVAIGGFKNGYFKDPKLVGSGKKLINVTELYQDFGIDITTDKVERVIVSPKDFEKYKVDIGDLFFTRSSLVLEGIAKSNIVRNLPEEAVFECHVMRLKPNKEVVVPEFLALFTGMPKARSYLMSMAKQVTMTTIAQPDMVGLPTPVPSLNEQQAIVEKVDAIDELIRKEKETVEKNKNIKKGLMQDLLTGKVKV